MEVGGVRMLREGAPKCTVEHREKYVWQRINYKYSVHPSCIAIAHTFFIFFYCLFSSITLSVFYYLAHNE